jgi:hypothetical protein
MGSGNGGVTLAGATALPHVILRLAVGARRTRLGATAPPRVVVLGLADAPGRSTLGPPTLLTELRR